MNSIDSINGHDAACTYLQQSAARSAGASAASVQPAGQAHHAYSGRKPDSVTLSDNARSLASARAQVVQAPDVREHRVAEIKHQLSSGTYHVPAHVLARKMVDASKNPI